MLDKLFEPTPVLDAVERHFKDELEPAPKLTELVIGGHPTFTLAKKMELNRRESIPIDGDRPDAASVHQHMIDRAEQCYIRHQSDSGKYIGDRIGELGFRIGEGDLRVRLSAHFHRGVEVAMDIVNKFFDEAPVAEGVPGDVASLKIMLVNGATYRDAEDPDKSAVVVHQFLEIRYPQDGVEVERQITI